MDEEKGRNGTEWLMNKAFAETDEANGEKGKTQKKADLGSS